MKLFPKSKSLLMKTTILLVMFCLVAFYFYISVFVIDVAVSKKIYYSPRLTVVNSWNQTFWIDGRNICKTSPQLPYLLLLVLSVPKSFERRRAIRKTWSNAGNWPNFKTKLMIKIVFLMGKYPDNKTNAQVQNEQAKYGDIVAGNFYDSYRNLTLKVLSGLSWVRRYCESAKFVVKMDDDTFINIPLLYRYLEMSSSMNFTILGYVVMNAEPVRKGKYYVSIKSFSQKFYPPYTTGNMYIATPRTFTALLDVARYQPRMEMEDVFITGILAKIAKVHHRAFPRGMYSPRRRAAACEFVRNTKIFSKDYEAKDVLETWNVIRHNRNKCK